MESIHFLQSAKQDKWAIFHLPLFCLQTVRQHLHKFFTLVPRTQPNTRPSEEQPISQTPNECVNGNPEREPRRSIDWPEKALTFSGAELSAFLSGSEI